jgi:DNA adenine methylase
VTFLRWAGSKKQLLDQLSHCWHAANGGERKELRYIEAFSGSASLFFHLSPKKALLIDINEPLQSCLISVQNHPELVAMHLENLAPNKETYYEVRKLIQSENDSTRRAAYFIFLNRLCFNGLFRTNQAGIFNVPFGGGKTGRLPDESSLIHFSKALANVEIVWGDFYESIRSRIKKTDFVYLDPPYASRNKNLDFQYGPDVFGVKDMERLVSLLVELDRKDVPFVLSYADCPEVRDITKKWSYASYTVSRSIAASPHKRQSVDELLISNI